MAKTIRQTLRGRSDFVSDLYLRNMLYGATVRSPYPHARILKIESRGVPAEVCVVTAADIPGSNALRIGDETMPVLADEICRYAGEPVALVAGPNQQEVVAAIGQLSIEYEELEPSFDFSPDASESVAFTTTGTRGKPDRMFARSTQVVEGTYHTGIQEHMYNEPQGAVARIDAEGSIQVHCATQWPYHVRDTVAESLAMKASDCVVFATDTGVDLDGKLWYPSLVAAHAALLSTKAGAPVKLVYSNLEDFQFSSKRSPVIVTHLAGLDETGKVIAARITMMYNCGAYPLFTGEMVDRLAASALGLYHCKDVSVTIKVIQTNLPPLNVLSGFGTASAHFAAETHLSRIVEILGAEPVEFRLEALGNTEAGSFGAKPDAVSLAIRHVVRESDFSRKNAAYQLQKKRQNDDAPKKDPVRGIGIAVAAEGNGFVGSNEGLYNSAVSVQLGSDGTAVLRTSTTPRNEGLRSYWIRLVAEGLGLEPASVQLISGNTDETPDSGPATLSRSILISGRLITQACSTIQRRRFRDPLPIEVKRSYRAPKNASWDTATLTGTAFPNHSFGAVVVEVVVDPVTFQTTVLDVWLSVDAGKVIGADGVRRSLEIGIYQALEWSMHESVEYTRGAVNGRSYLSYRNTGRPNLPGIHITLLDSAVRDPRGVGTLPYNCVPAAFAAAVSQATGRYMDRIPTNPELIHGYLEQE